MELNRSFFSRNRHREIEYDDVFSLTYKSLSTLSHLIFIIIFPPVITISNLFSNDFFLIFLNICLATAYCTKFIYKINENEVSFIELATTLFFICISLSITFYLAPTVSFLTLIDVVGLVNLIATGINSFFLVRNILLPPFEALLVNISHSFGFNIKSSFFEKAPFSLEKDRHVIDRLLRKYYKHDSFSEYFNEAELTPFNNVITVLSQYINKYNARFLGSIIYHERIASLENAVSQFILNGNTDSSSTFIHKKIDFKLTKIKLLNQAKAEFINENTNSVYKFNHTFFKSGGEVQENQQTYHECLSLLTQEIERQNQKLELLRRCVL